MTDFRGDWSESPHSQNQKMNLIASQSVMTPLTQEAPKERRARWVISTKLKATFPLINTLIFLILKKNAECPNTHQYFFNFKITVTDNTGCGLHRQQTDKHYDPDTAA